MGRSVKLRGIGPPHPKQQELIDYLFKPDPDNVKQVDLCCGRGYGKSNIAIDIATRALSLSPNEIGLFLEPDWKRVNRVFLRKWRRIVPKELYTINHGEQCIKWINGSLLYYSPRNITGSYAQAEDAQLGIDTTFIIDDEAALRCSDIMYTNNLATIREPSNVRFYLTVSTPRVGAYKRLVTSPKHVLFRGHSDDNPYLPDGFVENLKANMSPEQARRELAGEFTSLRGRVWKTAKYQAYDENDPDTLDYSWPNGNRHDTFTQFDPKRPWWLACDFGSATGAYVVIQQTEAAYKGRELFPGPVWVAVADLCPEDDASASRAFQRLKTEFGFPALITGGTDMDKTDDVQGKTIAAEARQIWSNVSIVAVSERTYHKRSQFDSMNFLMYSATGHRRFAVARDFVSIDEHHRYKRGVREMIHEDEWPKREERRESDYLPKNKNILVQHTRDALLMWAVTVHSPQWVYTNEPAG
jgi:hypothetical protein